MSTTARQKAAAARREAEWQAGFESLARRFYVGVYNYLRWITRDVSLAEDLTQETFMQIWQHPPETQGDGALKAWVYRIARNQYLQHRRRAGLQTVAFEDCAEAEMADRTIPDPQLSLERERQSQAVRRAVEKLPDHYREVIVLHNLEHLSVAQIAAILQIPKGTVKSRRAAALSRLRRLLHQQEVGNDEV